jgi:hypothetical protein
MSQRVNRFFYFDCAFGTTCDRILYDALTGEKVAKADWADPANRSESYGGGMEATFGSKRDLQEKVDEDACQIKSPDRYAFHERWCDNYYGTRQERERANAEWDW